MKCQYFTVAEATILQRATMYEELATIALAQLRRMQETFLQSPSIICGPISNGGRGSIAANIEYFEAAVAFWVHEREGCHFSQIPYEETIWRIRDRDHARGIEYPKGSGNPILEQFYRPIFESGLIGALKFLPGWETSDGARWERALGEALGLHIYDLSEDYRLLGAE